MFRIEVKVTPSTDGSEQYPVSAALFYRDHETEGSEEMVIVAAGGRSDIPDLDEPNNSRKLAQVAKNSLLKILLDEIDAGEIVIAIKVTNQKEVDDFIQRVKNAEPTQDEG